MTAGAVLALAGLGANSGPSGPAGGALTGTYPNPSLATTAIPGVYIFNGIPDGMTDNSALFATALASFPTTWDGNTYSYAGVILVPYGQYYFASSIPLNRQVHIIGVGSPAGNALGLCQFLFADNIDGFQINHANVPSNGALGADGTIIEGLYIKRSGNSGGTLGHGINANCRFELRNCLIDSFRLNGINIVADSGGSPSTNANSWHIQNVRSISNGQDGFYCQGGDVNAGYAFGLDCSSNTRNGIYDSSFLGNMYVGCHTASNGGKGYKADNNNARNKFDGCYTEGGETHSIIFPSLVVGGILATLGTAIGTCQIIGDSKQTPFSTYNADANTKPLFGGDSSGVETTFYNLEENGGTWPHRQKHKVGGRGIDWANNGNYFLELLNSQATIANGYPRDMTASTLPQSGGVWFRAGFFIGGGSSGGSFWQEGSAAPTTGTYQRNDIVWNNAPTSGGFVGWICTVGGSPGTWKTFGAIS